MSKKPEAAAADAAPPKSKKMLIIVIVLVLVILLGGAAAAYFIFMKPHPARGGEEPVAAEHVDEEEHAAEPPKYLDLGTYTANLMQEEGDRYLQVSISLKVSKATLEEKVKNTNPEIQHRVNMVLQSKRPSELATLDGKNKLAEQLKEQIQYVLGLRKEAPPIEASKQDDGHDTADEHSNARDDRKHDRNDSHGDSKPGVEEVLFTSFIVQ